MRIVVVGCGGIGGVMAARLTRAGYDVTPVTGNAAIAAALVAHGYRVKEWDGTTWEKRPSGAPRVDPGGGPYDLCIVATKLTTLAPALAAVKPFLRAAAPVLVCQNGLPEQVAADVVGPERVLGGVVVWGASMDSRHPGTYVCTTKRGKLKLGRAFAESPDPAPVARVLAAVAAIDVLTDPAALAAARWAKLAINCATSTIGAIGGDRLGPLLGRRPVRRLVLELWSEIHAVVRAAGIRPAPIAGVDLSRLALSPRERRSQLGSPLLAGKHALLMAVGMKYRRMRSSMLIALERGRTPEIDFLNGEIVRRGTALGVPAPVNARLVAAVKAIAAGEASSSIDHLQKVCSEVMALSRAAAAVQQAPGLAAEPGLERSPTETAPSP